ncbi:LLM class F420-dependent oxidoreductase [Micromonospora siamensis]|uniref:Probable F420-dependent oxidoreductase, MSMEG_2906 family n=1 Tax=Micromonospora siamensis TaxID=299152 RepID=A0A1C5J7I4_9ACTN|nr:LLM class F420-dependent oxidoreductase [Micromonospora siamensis]SCG66221.1 probable F420-dependent oxidoreductase, MSMEG_2906 family [Micromonospora siamensis]
MARFKVGVQIRPQHCSMSQLREAWRAAEDLGVDTIWNWDHFFPLYGDPDGAHYECWTMLAALAADTSRVRFGPLVACNSYRNPDLLADMARTVDEISEGRLVLGLGAGWFERDYTEFGYEFGTAGDRLRALGDAVPRIQRRLATQNPPTPHLPLLIGGGGEKVTLRIVAERADLWNDFGSPERYAHKNAVLDEWCAKVGRDPDEIERTTMINADEIDDYDAYLKAGATHIILAWDAPFDPADVERLLANAKD